MRIIIQYEKTMKIKIKNENKKMKVASTLSSANIKRKIMFIVL